MSKLGILIALDACTVQALEAVKLPYKHLPLIHMTHMETKTLS